MNVRDREALKQEIEALIGRHLAAKESGGPEWTQPELDGLITDLHQSLVADLHPAEANPDLTLLESALGDFCSMKEPVSKWALDSCISVWRKAGDDKIDLLVHLAALAPSALKLREFLSVDHEQKDDELIEVSTDGFADLVGLLSECAQPEKFSYYFSMSTKRYFQEKSINPEAHILDGANFTAWFRQRCTIEPTHLLEFSDADLIFEVDPQAYLNLGDSAAFTAEQLQRLATLVHESDNAFVMRNLAPSTETSLRDVVEGLAKTKEQTQLTAADFPEFLEALEKCRYQNDQTGSGYYLPEVLDPQDYGEWG